MIENNKLIIAFMILLSLVSLTFGIVAVATNEWKMDKSLNITYGLFATCHTEEGTCTIFKRASASLKAVRGVMIIGDLLALIAFLLTIFHAIMKLKYGNIIITAVLAASGLFLLIGCSIYTGKSRSGPNKFCLGYSFGLAWASGPISWVAAMFAILTQTNHQNIP